MLHHVDDAGAQLLVVFAAPGMVEEPAARAAALAVLDNSERAKMDRFVFARDRDLYLTMHAVQRRLLSAITGDPPAGWRFVAGPYGRPELAPPVRAPLSINGSHTHGMTMCGLARGAVIGVDVEQLRNDAPVDVSDQFFSPAEHAAIRAAPRAEQGARFLTAWTLKESYMKARGLGMSLPLDQFTIELVHGTPPRLHVEPAWDDGIIWHFEILRPSAQHLAAVCHNAALGTSVTVLPDTWATLNATRDRPIL